MQRPFDDILRNRERIGWMQRPFDDVLRDHQQRRCGSLLAVRSNFDENLGYAGSSGYGAVVRKSGSVNQSRWRRLGIEHGEERGEAVRMAVVRGCREAEAVFGKRRRSEERRVGKECRSRWS